MYAFNYLPIKGFYLTDLIKNEEDSSSSNILRKIREEKIAIEDHVRFFITEIKSIKISESSIFILFGNAVEDFYNKYYKDYFESNKVIKIMHYNPRFSRITDREWVEETWRKLNLKMDYNLIPKKK